MCVCVCVQNTFVSIPCEFSMILLLLFLIVGKNAQMRQINYSGGDRTAGGEGFGGDRDSRNTPKICCYFFVAAAARTKPKNVN